MLVVGLAHGDDISWIGATVLVRRNAIPPEPSLGRSTPVRVEPATLNLVRRRLVGHTDRIEVEVRLGPAREVEHVLEGVLGTWPEFAGDRVGFLPHVLLDPAPAHVLQSQHQLEHVRVPLTP